MSKAKNVEPEMSDAAAVEASGLGFTVGAFENRIRRQLREQEERDSASQKLATERHALMMQGMTISRKALQETAKINIGKRFYLDLDINDADGWPHLEISLIDTVAPDMISHALRVTAHDRQQLGTIQINMLNGEVLAKAQLCDPKELTRLPLMLKKSIRTFLDLVAAYVLNPRSPEELLALNPVQSSQLEEEPSDGVDDKLKGQDLFVDSDVQAAISHKSNVISVSDHPALQPVLISDEDIAAKKSIAPSQPKTKERVEDTPADDLESALESLKF